MDESSIWMLEMDIIRALKLASFLLVLCAGVTGLLQGMHRNLLNYN